jgi:hypothetical protein
MLNRSIEIICSSCQTVMKKADADAGEVCTSHGLCKTCYHHFMALLGVPLDQYIEGLNVPTVAVTANGTIGAANEKARTMLGKAEDEIEGHLGGDVFGCRYALLPEGCGRTIHCSGCTIRNTVMDTMETGRAHGNIPAVLNLDSEDEDARQTLLISTVKRGGMVFLSVRAAAANDVTENACAA